MEQFFLRYRTCIENLGATAGERSPSTKKSDEFFRSSADYRIRIGRGAKAEVKITRETTTGEKDLYEMISRCHCIIERRDDGFYLIDTSSGGNVSHVFKGNVTDVEKGTPVSITPKGYIKIFELRIDYEIKTGNNE